MTLVSSVMKACIRVFVLGNGHLGLWSHRCIRLGDTPHRIVCEIAFRLALPETRTEIKRLIRNDEQFEPFRDACIFPDHPRRRASEHFINFPRDSSGLAVLPAHFLTSVY